MAKKKAMTLGDLTTLMAQYRDDLKKAKATSQFDDEGNLTLVDQKKVDQAIKSLDTAVTDMSRICQQGVLAIMIEP